MGRGVPAVGLMLMRRGALCIALLFFAMEGIEEFIGRKGLSQRALADVWSKATGTKKRKVSMPNLKHPLCESFGVSSV